jgi:hypothetical protein
MTILNLLDRSTYQARYRPHGSKKKTSKIKADSQARRKLNKAKLGQVVVASWCIV